MDGILRIDRVVAQFEVWVDSSFPFTKFKVKVLERGPGEMLAIANVAVRNHESAVPEYEAGMGDTVEESLRDLLSRFFESVRRHTTPSGLTEHDFAWSVPEDF
jgi:hypothetical protein